MAKHATYRWRDWRTDLNGGTVRTVTRPPASAKPNRGITNAQAKLLARLQRRAGEPYSGRGLTAAQADQEIRRLTGPRRP